MKIKLVLLLLLSSFLLVGCDQRNGYANLVRRFPDSERVLIPGSDYDYIVRDASNQVWLVFSNGVNGESEHAAEYVKAYLLFPSKPFCPTINKPISYAPKQEGTKTETGIAAAP